MPSLYESTPNTGEVSSSNFTTLYNASGLAVPNAGAGSITGNLNVGGNLTVQGSSLLIGEVILQSTLSLPNYTFPLPDGATDQVLVTDGSGNLYWTNVNALPGAEYNISANTVVGGANLTLANTAGDTDSVKFASGTGISVSRTDASTITITNTAPDTNTTYTINASATTGGANFNLVGSDSTTDSIKFAGGTNVTVTRTDANTITIATNADDIPNGTAQGQVLYWDGSAWVASSNITSAAANDRFVLQYNNSGAGSNAAVFLRKNFGATPYTTGSGANIAFQVDSDSQALNQYAQLVTSYNATAPVFDLQTSIGGGTVGPYVSVGSFTSAQATLPGDLAVNGGDITTTSATGNLFNTTAVIVNIGNAATTEVNLGNTSSGQVQIKPNTIIGANTTQNVFNTVATTVNAFGAATNITMGVDGAVAGAGTTTIRSATTVVKGDLQVNGDNTGLVADISTTKPSATVFNTTATTVNAFGAASTLNVGANTGTMTIGNPTVVGTQTTQNLYNTTATTVNAFGAANALNMASATSLTTLGNNLSINGTELKINADGAGSPADSFIYFNGTNESLKWNQADTRFEFSDQLYITQAEVPAIFERRVTTAEVNPNEALGAVRLLQRVTDAAGNNTDDGGPAVVFGRTSGATTATEQRFASMGSVWFGATTKASINFNWSPDNFPEPSPGVYPTSYNLLGLNSDEAKFFNNSLYIDYAYVDSTKTATSITGGNTLVFGSAHGYTAGTRILYQTASANGLTQSTYYYVLATGLTSTQCRVSTTSGGSAVALTNGTGLTLTFASVSNRIGINTTTPTEVLDVNGNANIAGVVTVQGDAVTINSDKTDTDVYLNFGRVAPANNAAIRWNALTDSFEWSADSTTWYDFIDVVLTSPQEGQSIIYNGTNWENSNEFEFINLAYRSKFINNISTAGSIVSAEFLKRRTGSLVNGNSSGIFMGQVVSATETYTHRLVSQYESTGNNEYLIQVDPVGNFNPASTTVTTQLALDNTEFFLAPKNITLNGNAVAPFTGLEAGLTVNRATNPINDATFKWIEDDTRWAANGSIYTAGNFIADGPNIQVNADSTAADSFLYMKGTAEYLKWDDTATQFEFSDDLEVLGNVNATSFNIDGDRGRLDTGNTTTWATGTTITLSTTAKNVSKCLFYISDNTSGAVHTVEALALRIDATTAKLTTYGEMYSGSALATFTADVSSGSLRIRGTSTSANTLTVSIMATTLL